MKSTEESLYLAIDMVKPGVRLGDLGAAIQKYNEDNGYSVVRQFVGHGVGKNLHEDPEVPNYGKAGHGIRERFRSRLIALYATACFERSSYTIRTSLPLSMKYSAIAVPAYGHMYCKGARSLAIAVTTMV